VWSARYRLHAQLTTAANVNKDRYVEKCQGRIKREIEKKISAKICQLILLELDIIYIYF